MGCLVAAGRVDAESLGPVMRALLSNLPRWMARVPRGWLVLLVIWLLGLATLGAVLLVQQRLDQRRRAQVAVADLRLQVNLLPRIALNLTHRLTPLEVRGELRAGEASIATTARRLDGLSGGDRDATLIMSRARPAFALLDLVSVLASSGHFQSATNLLGLTLLPGGAGYKLNAAFDEVDAEYDRQAADARALADAGTIAAIVLMLIAFSLALQRAIRLAGENRRLLEQSRADAFTDDLTGLPNRRKLLADINELLGPAATPESLVLGMFDLNGFKAYNDMFGHPEGDVLLTRLGRRLEAAVDGAGQAYRMGGDEFCVIARGAGADAVLERALLRTHSGRPTGTCTTTSARRASTRWWSSAPPEAAPAGTSAAVRNLST
jgi:diguanylate cyclase (GGDEF)-like protein